MNEALPPDASGTVPVAADGNAAGNALRQAREAVGMTIEGVAQQLKLAPRQVAALENGNYADLPGRTFVRGFARNYARLLQLDADAVVAALPDATASPAMGQPTLGGGSGTPAVFAEGVQRRPRWKLPLLLVLLIGVAAVVELHRSGALTLPGFDTPPAKPAIADPVVQPATQGTGTPLPNPLASAPDTTAAPSNAPAEASLPITAAPVPIAPAPGASAPAPGAAAPASTSSSTLVIEYRAASWTEVRDASGNRLLVGTMPAGSKQTITGAAPFEVVLGNVAQTTVTWRGATVDTSAYHKQNVARLQLQ